MTDFIEVYDEALSADQCKQIIEYIEAQTMGRGAFAGGRLDLRTKDCWQVPDMRFSNKDEASNLVIECLKQTLSEYRRTHPQITRSGKWGLDDAYNLQKYDPNGAYFKSHCENDSKNNPRMLAWMVYLNTVTDGGGTYFEGYDKTLEAVEGRMVIWPAYWTHHHNGIVSPTETKYIATGWFSFK